MSQIQIYTDRKGWSLDLFKCIFWMAVMALALVIAYLLDREGE